MNGSPSDNNTDLSTFAQELVLSEAPDRELEALLYEVEETAELLRGELAARGRNRARGLTPDQHAEIDRLPEYLNMTNARWTTLLDFFRTFTSELRKGPK
ncbi:hypothetical protein [Corynebacterium sp. LK2510]|uniref:hypothetical protein n=1 Tax=Corynebacterium sp. LK2510 TaxID=3110472 RepID=UPI0034CF5A39